MSEKEYIERGALKAHYSWLPKDATLTPKDFDDIIDAQPAADVEPVVRCKDCERWNKTASDTPNERYCSFMGKLTRSDFFCGRARAHMERSDEND